MRFSISISGWFAVLFAVTCAGKADAAGQGLSDTLAHCEPATDAAARVAGLTAAIEGLAAGEELFRNYLLRGKAKSENCSFRAALADFEQALNAKPVALNVPAEYLIARGDAHLRLGEHDPALADFNAAAAKSPNFDELAHIHQMRGYIHSDKGEERLAITEFTALIRLKPDFADAYWLRAVSYENLDDYAHALADYDQLARLRPDDWTGWSQSCWGHAYQNTGLEEGLHACDRALLLNPGDANTLDGRGFVNLRLGRYASAIADYDAALSSNPRLAGSLFLRGIARIRLGDSQSGQRDMLAAERLEIEVAKRFAAYGVVP